MIDLQVLKIYAVGTWDKLKRFDWKKLIPSYTVSHKYQYAAFPLLIELTQWEGIGLGISLGKYDLWVGWPNDRQVVQKALEAREVLVGEIV